MHDKGVQLSINLVLIVAWFLINSASVFGIPKISYTTQTALWSFGASLVLVSLFYSLNKHLFPRLWKWFLTVFAFVSILLIVGTSESGSMATPDREFVTWVLLWFISALTILTVLFKFATRK